MADKNCQACSDLQENSPEFVLNGVTDNVHNALINDNGFNTSSGHNDCTDLNNANDCLIGNMEDEIDSYEVCDWKLFMPNFIHNLWTVLKAIISAICGLWTKVNKHECEINYMYEGQKFSIGEETTGDAYVVAGKGVSFLKATESSDNTSDIHLRYIAGGLMLGGGSLKLYTSSFYEPKQQKVGNFDHGTDYRVSNDRQGNSLWDGTGVYASGGELMYEIRIKKSAYPQIKALFTGFGTHANAGAFMVNALVFNEGRWAYGQHGSCLSSNGNPSHDGYDGGHKVPTGWVYIQIRMSYCMVHASNGMQRSPHYFLGVRMNQDGIDCSNYIPDSGDSDIPDDNDDDSTTPV